MIRVSFAETLQLLLSADTVFTNDLTTLPKERYIFPFDESKLTGDWTDATVTRVDALTLNGQALIFKVKEKATTDAKGGTTYQYASYW